MDHQPIENYGLIGDMHTAALVGLNGSIDWLCVPRFDSPSVFARILDADKGGHFSIAPVDPVGATKQHYWPETNILITRFLDPAGAAELIDFMPVGGERRAGCTIVRRVCGLMGEVRLRLECRPAFDYARAKHSVRLINHGAEFISADRVLSLAGAVPLQIEPGAPNRGDAAVCEFTMKEGQSLAFVLRSEREPAPTDADHLPGELSPDDAEDLFRRTVHYWRNWVSVCPYTGRWRETVLRSALAMKLMTYEPTGAIVAAPTCSLPEEIGGVRNWDYRYMWIRDAAFTIYAFLRLGFRSEAKAYMQFLERICADHDGDGPPLRTMYAIDGGPVPTEETLDHLSGYKGSKPVRIGNAASDQLQLDMYGELLDAAYLFNKWGEPVSADLWLTLRRMVDYVCDHWHLEDHGIWEVRNNKRHFVFSKFMCWVAVDRGLRLAEKRSFPADRDRWERIRDEIYTDVFTKGWNPDVQAFTQSYGSAGLDAANLLMPLTFFLSPTDPRMLKTLDAIMKPPSEGGLLSSGLVYRYDVSESPDGLRGGEGAFNLCTFWLVEALARAGQFNRPRLDEARLIFERMLGYANHLGLFAEETGHSAEALGNYPQAFTHLALISAAFNLDRQLGK